VPLDAGLYSFDGSTYSLAGESDSAGNWSFSTANIPALDSLNILVGDSAAGTVDLTVTSTTTETSNSDSAVVTASVSFDVITPNLDLDSATDGSQTLFSAAGLVDELISLDITAGQSGTIGTELLTVTIDNVPTGAVFYNGTDAVGTDNGGGSWSFAAATLSADLYGLDISSSVGVATQQLTVTSILTDADNNTSYTSGVINLTVEAASDYVDTALASYDFAANTNLADDSLPTFTVTTSLDSDTDVDYYTFSVGAGEQIILDIDGGLDFDGNPLDTMIWLYDEAGLASGSELAENDWAEIGLGGGGSIYEHDAFLSYTNETGSEAVFTAAVSGYYNDPGYDYDSSTQTGEYTLNISVGTPAFDYGNTTDEAYDLGTFAAGDALATIISDSVGSSDEFDYFSFSLGSDLDVTVDLFDLTADADVTIFDSTGAFIDGSWNGADTSESLTISLVAGDYFVGVQNYDAAVNYSFDMSVTGNSDPAGEWIDEALVMDFPAGGFVSGDSATITAATVSWDDWSDFYSFDLAAESTVTISTTSATVGADTDLELMDEFGGWIDGSWNWNSAAESLTTTLAAGTYNVEVTNWYDMDVTYDLTVAVSEPLAENAGTTVSTSEFVGILTSSNTMPFVFADVSGAVNAADFGDSSMLGYSTTASMTGAREIDYYSFYVEAGQEVTLDIDNGVDEYGFDMDSQIWVYNSIGASITDNDWSDPFMGGDGSDSWYDAYVTFTAEEAGTYYVAVTNFYNDPKSPDGYEWDLGTTYTLNASIGDGSGTTTDSSDDLNKADVILMLQDMDTYSLATDPGSLASGTGALDFGTLALGEENFVLDSIGTDGDTSDVYIFDVNSDFHFGPFLAFIYNGEGAKADLDINLQLELYSVDDADNLDSLWTGVYAYDANDPGVIDFEKDFYDGVTLDPGTYLINVESDTEIDYFLGGIGPWDWSDPGAYSADSTLNLSDNLGNMNQGWWQDWMDGDVQTGFDSVDSYSFYLEDLVAWGQDEYGNWGDIYLDEIDATLELSNMVVFDGSGSAGANFEIFDAAGTSYGSASGTDLSDLVINTTLQDNTWYHIDVTPDASTLGTSRYELSLEISNYNLEKITDAAGDTFASAKEIGHDIWENGYYDESDVWVDGSYTHTAIEAGYSEWLNPWVDVTLDTTDMYMFNLDDSLEVEINLEWMNDDANLTLFDAAGTEIGWSGNLGSADENITSILDPGTYYVAVDAVGSDILYTLSMYPSLAIDDLGGDWSEHGVFVNAGDGSSSIFGTGTGDSTTFVGELIGGPEWNDMIDFTIVDPGGAGLGVTFDLVINSYADGSTTDVFVFEKACF
jgi:hypothetical protein